MAGVNEMKPTLRADIERVLQNVLKVQCVSHKFCAVELKVRDWISILMYR